MPRFAAIAAAAVAILTSAGAWPPAALADIFCAGNGARTGLVLRHVGRVAGSAAARDVQRRLPPTRAGCTTCHLPPGPESLLLANTAPLWPMNAYGQALTILRPGLPPGGFGDDAATLDAFERVDRLPTDPGDPAAPTYGDRIRRGLPPMPLFPMDDDEPRADNAGISRGHTTLSFNDALKLVVTRDGPILQESEVAEIDARTASALARFDGTLLMLGLRSLPLDVASNLATSRAGTLWLHSLTEIGPDAAAVLSALPGTLLLTGLGRLESADLAAKLAAQPGPLALPFLRSISAAAARALVDRDDRVCLPALANAPAEVQDALAAARCRLDLPALARLESDELARKLAASPVVYLGGLEDVSANVVEIVLEPVAGRRAVVLSLDAVSAATIEALQKARPTFLGQAIFVGRDLSAERLRDLAALSAAGAAPGARLRATCFPEITELSADLEAVAAACDASFPNLRRIDSAALAAAVITRDDGFLTLGSLGSITAAAAREISAYKPREGLRLSSLRQLPPDVAEALLGTTRPFMDLGGLWEISTESLTLLLTRIQNKGSSASLNLGVSRLPPGPFAPPAEARRDTQRFDLNLRRLAALSADDARNLVAVMRPSGGYLSITVPELPAEAADVLADWGGGLVLSGLETVPPGVAKALARLPGGRGYRGSINLDRVTTIEPGSLVELTQAKRSFNFGGLREITPELARAFVKCQACGLRFPFVTRISPEVAAVLVTGTAQALMLPGLTTLEPEVAAALAACPSWDPVLPGVTSLAPDAAAALASFVSRRGDLQLPGLTTLEPEVAAALARCERFVPVFPAVRAIEPAAVAALAACRRPVGLPGLTPLTPEVAAALAVCPPWNGALSGITGFDAPDSVKVATALAARQGALSLPALRRISPKTLAALLAKPDVEIPLIETLTLIAEPDGSPTEDVVIPADFQQQQRLRRRGS